MYTDKEVIRNKLAVYAEKCDVYTLADCVFNHPDFYLWSGSSNSPHKHHYGEGGLAQHTMEVVDLALSTAAYFGTPHFQMRQLFVAALYHDVGKMWDYAKDANGVWINTDHKYKIHHIVKSVLWFREMQFGYPCGLTADDCNEIVHMILAHHGRKEWSSPVEPQTKLAWYLHLADMTSARNGQFDVGH